MSARPELERYLSGATAVASPTQDGGKPEFPKSREPASWCLQPQVAFKVRTDFWRPANFAKGSSLDVLEASADEQVWLTGVGDSQIKELVARHDPIQNREPRLLALFISLVTEENIGCTYDSQASLSQWAAKSIIDTFGVDDAFLPDLIGRPDYWAPYVLHDSNQSTYQFHCQHPRWQKPQKWHQHRYIQRAPSSVYMKYFKESNLTLYLIAAAPNDDCITILREKLTHSDSDVVRPRLQAFAECHPFLLHSTISSIVVEQSKDSVHHVRKTLMTQINGVNDYGKPASETLTAASRVKGQQTMRLETAEEVGRSGRAKLEAITRELHLVSQMADTGIANTEKAIEDCEYIQTEYVYFNQCFGVGRDQIIESSNRYSLNVWRCQRRLLVSYKARKETSMNLVFNLVTQQDSAVNVDIASKMMQDSSSMKTIAILTMVFLPGTFVCALFSSGIFIIDNESGLMKSSQIWQPLLWTIIPLTLATMSLWAMRSILRRAALGVRSRALQAVKNTRPRAKIIDLEQKLS